MIDIFKSLSNALLEKIKSYSPDYNENDPSSIHYIKNRPFYTYRSRQIILEECTIDTSGSEAIPVLAPLELGKSYIVTWDGVEYTCGPSAEYDIGYGFFGNTAIYEYDGGIEIDTGEPFAIEWQIGGDSLWAYTNDEDAIHTIKIEFDSEAVEKLDKKYLPDDLATQEFVIETTDQAISNLEDKLNTTLEDKLNTTLEDKLNTIINNYLAMKDKVTGKEYFITIENGNIVCSSKVVSIEITKVPDIMEYYEGTDLDSSMIITATYEDGKTSVITDYTAELIAGNTSAEISYTENGVTCTTTLDGLTIKSVEELLVDFAYTVNNDGTYNITGWKGTYNGVESTELHVPNNSKIIV